MTCVFGFCWVRSCGYFVFGFWYETQLSATRQQCLRIRDECMMEHLVVLIVVSDTQHRCCIPCLFLFYVYIYICMYCEGATWLDTSRCIIWLTYRCVGGFRGADYLKVDQF